MPGERAGEAAKSTAEVKCAARSRPVDLLPVPVRERVVDDLTAGGVELFDAVRPVGKDVMDRAVPRSVVPSITRGVKRERRAHAAAALT
jgi:hypothetical protein